MAYRGLQQNVGRSGYFVFLVLQFHLKVCLSLCAFVCITGPSGGNFKALKLHSGRLMAHDEMFL